MSYNKQHHTTFIALLKLWGVPSEIAEPISNQLAHIDNNQQDQLIALMTDELQKRQKPQ